MGRGEGSLRDIVRDGPADLELDWCGLFFAMLKLLQEGIYLAIAACKPLGERWIDTDPDIVGPIVKDLWFIYFHR